ncbi:MAG TPA: ATP synthase F0 subunit C [Candidatus Saccharimonadales bacterium]|jgi:F0F1-type ATP synthase membrane subunit c/vacuolar-type H+-ATPase subunit K|nr:ATP synthase F0 subunit C [Candidatus Saccharimonadales bacterium]
MVMLADAVNTAIIGKGIMIGMGFIGPTIGMGIIGGNFLQAVGRNPEAAKFIGQAFVFIGLIEVYGLLAFAATFFVK